MSVSAASLRKRWDDTNGRDPIFAAIDGGNCPDAAPAERASHSLLLDRGLFRIALPWPPRGADGRPTTPEFTIEVVRDPTGCNTSPRYGLTSAQPSISVFRRPRPVANLAHIAREGAVFNIKTGLLSALDPDTGKPSAMNLLADSRDVSLKAQAISASLTHLEATTVPSREQLDRLETFERQLFMTQSHDPIGGSLVAQGGPPGLGPRAMAAGRPGVLGDYADSPVFLSFDPWERPGSGDRDAFRASAARGANLFMFRQFWIRDVAHLNSIGLGNPVKRTCATCHNAQLVGNDVAPGWMDLGTTTYPTWTEAAYWDPAAVLPVFKITCRPTALPHPYLGRVIYTTDPGRALATGKCADVGSIVMQQLRGLAARAPYFANGGAQTLRELVDYYDRRFDMKLTEIEKQDFVNFLRVL